MVPNSVGLKYQYQYPRALITYWQVTCFFQKKVVMELLVGRNDPLGSEIESHILAIEGSSVYSPVESIKCLEVGLKDYVRKQVGTRAGSEYHLIMKLELCKMLSAQCGQAHY